MSGYYDDNFGHWQNMDDPEMVKFYHKVAFESEEKQCVICGGTFRLRPSYDKCNRCADSLEGN